MQMLLYITYYLAAKLYYFQKDYSAIVSAS